MGTTAAELVDAGDRRDLTGRKLISEARRTAVLAAYDRSNLTQREFAAKEGVAYHTLITWLTRRRREQKIMPVHFAEVRMPRARAASEVCLPNGIVVRGGDVAEIVALVKALAR